MSKTWKEEHRKHRAKHLQETPQRVIDRLLKMEAQRDIRDAITTKQQGAPSAE